jgi:hypothetical protein
MILADTSAWIDYLRSGDTPTAGLLEEALDDDNLVMGDLILAEVMRGLSSEVEVGRVWTQLRNLQCEVLGGRDIAMVAAHNGRSLRSKGLTVRSTIDLMIGTWCIENGVSLIHKDRDFDGMERHLGLVVRR